MIAVYKPANAPEAHIIMHHLAHAGIDAVIFGEALQGAVGELQAFGFITLMVDEADFDAARALVKAWEQTPVPALEEDDAEADGASPNSPPADGPIVFVYGVFAVVLFTLAAVTMVGLVAFMLGSRA